MCGIAGMWRLTGPEPGDCERLEQMAASLVHRGPDDLGYLLANAPQGLTYAGGEMAADFVPDVLMASRRLSIIDLTTAGRQPIANEAGDVFVMFNGAIHNYLELRTELRALGHVFRSQTDTEIIVHAYEAWGEDCARRFNGMWAYVIWDQRRQHLVCSRDRFGIKPFVFAWQGGAFYFASEVKALLAGGDVRAVPNLGFVRRFLRSSNPANGRETAFEGIEQLPAGHNLVISRHGRRESPYWSYDERSAPYDFGRPEETFGELFADAVRIRLRSDVPYAILLSGGLDSSSIAVQARQVETAGALEAFTVTFPGFKSDERRYAELVSEHSGIRLTCIEFDPSHLLEDLSSVTWHMDAPPSQGQVLARWRLLEAASRRARIVLEGQGADEMLAGYVDRYLGPYVRSELAKLSLRNLHRRLPSILAACFRFASLNHVRSLRGASPPGAGHRVMSRDIAAVAERGEGRAAADGPHVHDRLTTALYRDHARLILPHLLHFGDAISMAHSVESRLPFLDHRLVEFVFGLPFDTKMRGAESKYILRRACGAILPPEITRRRDKVGFYTPLYRWLKPRFESDVRPLLTSRRVNERGIFDRAALAQCLAGFAAGKEGTAVLVFRCLALETWFELFVDGEGFRQGRGAAVATATRRPVSA